MQKIFKLKKILLLLFLLYTSFFIICGFLAPILAFSKHFYQADIIYVLMHRSCTQDALRCFWVLGYQMSICARCLGAYVGTFITLIFWFNKVQFDFKIYLFSILFSFGEIILEMLNFYSGNNFVRFLAGICLGMFIVFSLYYLFDSERKCEFKCLKK